MQEIDPQSAFLNTLRSSNLEIAQKYTEQVISQGFVPALIHYAQVFGAQGDQQSQFLLLSVAAKTYNSVDALFSLSIEMIKSPDTVLEGLGVLLELSKRGSKDAQIYVALCLSPFSQYPFQQKDGVKAFQLLNAISQDTKDNALVFYELAKFYHEGVGCEKNEVLSKAYYETALALDNRPIPSAKKKSIFTPTILFSLAGVATVTTIFLFAFLRKRR